MSKGTQPVVENTLPLVFTDENSADPPTLEAGREELPIPVQSELDNVWREVMFMRLADSLLADFLPYELVEENGKRSPLDPAISGRLVERILEDTKAGQPQAVHLMNAFDCLLTMQFKATKTEYKKARAGGASGSSAGLSDERIATHLKGNPRWEEALEEFSESFGLWAKPYGIERSQQNTKKAALDVTLVSKTSEFIFHTSQEMDALYRAQCNGKTFAGYLTNDQAGAIVYERNDLPHQIRLELTDAERAAGFALAYLEELVRAQDADAVLATEYILGVLAPPPHLPLRPYAGGWIDFDDVIKKIGWYPQSTKDRRAMHKKIWEFVKFGERAHINGQRTGAKYALDGAEINTSIHGAAWRVMKTETPEPSVLNTPPETPVRAEIVVSKELTALISNPATAQYLQGAEILGAIPGGKPAGAWARVLGMSLANFWRRKVREHSAGTIKPTRRELLDHYCAKVAPYYEVLESNDPRRAIDYWCGALQILADEGFIAHTGETTISAQEMRNALPRQNWRDAWLDQTVTIEVGEPLRAAFKERVAALPPLRPRDLKSKPRAKKKPKNS